MKILAVSDWIDPLIYSKSLRSRMKDIDIIISCGDLSASYLDYIMSILDKPLLYVVGNHVKRKYYEKSPSGSMFLKYPSCFINLHRRVKNQDGLLLCGFQGSHWYNGGPFQYRQWEVYLKMLKMVPRLLFNRLVHGRFVDLLVTHAPPYGIGDEKDPCHTGLKAFNLFIKLFKPTLMLHGHIHLYDRNETRTHYYNKTKIINCTGFITTEIDFSETRATINSENSTDPDSGSQPEQSSSSSAFKGNTS
jgi:Icc-related predicted phosphoesterase